MIRVNLLPARQAKRRLLLRTQLEIAILAFMLTVAGAGWLWIGQEKEHQARTEQLARIDAEIASLESLIKEVEDFKTRSAKLRKQIEVIDSLEKGQRRPAPILDALSQSLPQQVWLDKTKETGQLLHITGKSLNGMVGIAAFMENMGRSPWFGTAEIVEAKSETIADREVKTFTIKVPMTRPKKQATS
jgi:type IV pilus assembly protein PilN